MSAEALTATADASTAATATTQAAAQTAGSGVQEHWAKELISSDYSLNHKALDRLPDHLKGMRPTLEKYKSFEDVLVGFQNQQVMAGKKALAPLPPGAAPEVIAERKALLDTINGVPQNAKDYGIVRPTDLPEEHWNQPMAEAYSAWAQKNSVAPAAAKELMQLQLNTVKGQLQEQAKMEERFWNDEQQKFAALIQRENIPGDRAQQLVEKGALSLGLDINNEQTKTFLKGSDARLMAMRHAIAIGEDKAVTGSGSSSQGGNPEDLARDARSNPANPLYGPYWNKDGKYSRSDQESAVERINGWLRQAADKAPPRGKR